MDWRHVPSLSALRAFEAAARLTNYSAAARELNVTHAAIAQHVRRLEDHFGLSLMQRDGQTMQPTPEGQRLSRSLSTAFGQIAEISEDLIAQDTDRPLRIATTPSFAEYWLMPRIGAFWAANPEIRVEIAPSGDLVDLRADGFDLAIRYGRGAWPGLNTERLESAGHVVVAAPSVVGSNYVGCMTDLEDQHWLITGTSTEERVWLKANGLDLSKCRVTQMDVTALSLQAVRAGHGITIVPRAVAIGDIENGTLIALCEEIDSDLGYHILTRPDRVSPQLKTFIAWLRKQRETP
ncbi:LysR family transcriptional regulator [Cognatishimia sp. MH4019]|uniref:LysR family transcriptional regulator n=1 Tax=Cognatishimia sp. MH4019 TaxID=2854030 RepID=UPI001CD6E4CE|nr:LysR family transcriptional regulator [Cognatishimia sp. MH4019]